MQRRKFVQAFGAGVACASMAACASRIGLTGARVVVIGGGYGGATAAKHVRMWGGTAIDVTLLEPNADFVSCPLSNLVLGGSKQMADIIVPYHNLVKRYGVKLVPEYALSIDVDARQVNLANGSVLSYDRLILSPGIDFIIDGLPGLKAPHASGQILHAWKAGPQTLALRKQLEAIQDGGSFVITVPAAPFRCPPAPYERACQVAHYFKQAGKKAKVLILDANDDVLSKGPLFKKAWSEHYSGMIDYRPNFVVADVDLASNTVISEFDDKVKATVLNMIPAQRAGNIALRAGLANMNRRWCEVDFLTYESTQAQHIHVLGDAIQFAPLMPKSAQMANQQAKVCAAAVVDLLNGRTPERHPLLKNICYSFVTDKDAIHLSSVHTYNTEEQTMLVAPGSAEVSSAASELEGGQAIEWAQNIWADSLD